MRIGHFHRETLPWLSTVREWIRQGHRQNWSDYRVKSGGHKSFQLFFNRLSNLTKQGFVVAQVSTKEVKQRNLTTNIISLKMNNRTIDITVPNAVSGEGYAVHIDETLSK
jgi:hypothetical protein